MRFFTILVSVILSISVTGISYAANDNLYNQARDYFEDEGILKRGTKSTDTERITQAEFFKIILENTGYSPKPKSNFVPTPFRNVDPNSWYAPYIQKAYRIGLIDKELGVEPQKGLRTIDALKTILELEGYTIPKIYDEDVSSYKDLRTEDEKRIAAKVLQLNIYEPKSDKLFGAQTFLEKRDAIELAYKIYLITESGTSGYKPQTQIVNITTGSDLENIHFLESVRDQVFSKYYRSEEVSERELMNEAIKGFVNGLGDKYSVYFPPVDSKNFSENLDGTFEGIGAYIEQTDDGIVIQTPIEGAPAQGAGVKAGDIIKKVDGVDVEGMAIGDVVALIKGPKGTPVEIEFERDGQPVVITIVRDRVEIKSVTGKIENNVLVIKMNQFGTHTTTEFSDIITTMYNPSLEGIVVDLRFNPGGFLTVAEDILSFWIDEGEPIVQLQFKKYLQQEVAKNNQTLKDVPTAILINKASASASEIMAGTLQDYDQAEIFGETSFGKGSVQEVIQYRNGASLKLTVAEWLTGKGSSINGVGVSPDQAVEDNEDTDWDEALGAAMNWVRSQ